VCLVHSDAPLLGSLERFMSVYIEHCGGNFPAWIAPMQAIVLTVSDKTEEYGRDVLARLRAKNLRVEGGSVSVRSRDKGELGAMPFDQFVALLEGESKSPR
jgi:threonyl-tRNA synthetase